MNKLIIAFTIFAAFILLVEAGNPILPKRRICSLQALGTAKVYVEGYSTIETVMMRRVNEYVLYNFTSRSQGSMTNNFLWISSPSSRLG